MQAYVIDTQGEYIRITLPQFGVVEMSAPLPEGSDLDLLDRELRHFYYGRLKIVDQLPGDPVPVTTRVVAPKPRSRRK